MSQTNLVAAGRHRIGAALAVLSLFVLGFSACLSRPTFTPPSPHAPAEEPEAPREPVTLEPEAPLGAAPPVLWIHAANPVDPARLVLFHGRAGAAQVSQVRRGEISRVLRAQLVPIEIWSEDPSAADGAVDESGGIVIAPSEVLIRGDDYSLVSGEPARVTLIHVVPEDPTPILARVWPPPDASATARYAAWCGEAALPPFDEEVALAPAGLRGRIRRGVTDGDEVERCLHFEALPETAEEAASRVQPPPLVAHGDDLVRLDPCPLEDNTPGHPIAPRDCAPEEVPFGPGCALVADDRLTVRAPESPALWTIEGAGIDRVMGTAPGEVFVLRGLPPASTLTLAINAVDDSGVSLRSTFTFATLASMPHLILNEILANPLGAEPQQEWVEILNDGLLPAELAGHVLIDVGGETVLPAGTIPPGGYALIVNQSFVDDDGLDPAPEPGSLVVRVPKLGHGGLSNGGEPLALLDPSHTVISRSPVGPKTKAGMSLARVTPAAPDADKASFVLATPTPGRANAP